MTRKSRLQAILFAGALIVPPSVALAEANDKDTARQDQKQTQIQPSGQQSRGNQEVQRHLIELLRADNQAEVTIARLGSEKASRAEVKQYAQKLVDSHQQLLQKLQRSGQQASASGQSDLNKAGQQADAQRNDPSDATARASSGARGADAQGSAQATAKIDADTSSDTSNVYGMARGESGAAFGAADQLARIHQEVCQKKAESIREQLSQKQGTEFDKAFLGSQIMMHQGMIDKLEVYQRHVDSQTAGILRQAQQEARDHLQQAKSLKERSATAS
jgi:predicted outer membrane protein